MIITFLGTGTSQGIPVITCKCEVCQSLHYKDKRLRSAIHIATQNKSFVIDTGPDFRQQMLRESIQEVDAVIFTHEHKDHTAGLDDIRSYNFVQNRDIPIYGTNKVLEQLKREFAYIFATEKYPGIPKVELHEITNNPFIIDGVKIVPIEVLHYKLPVLGYRFENFTYITDAKSIAEEEKEKIKNSEVLVINALQKTEHISHFTLDEAIALIEELSPKKAYLTHIGHNLGLHHEIEKELPENTFLAYDGLKIEL